MTQSFDLFLLHICPVHTPAPEPHRPLLLDTCHANLPVEYVATTGYAGVLMFVLQLEFDYLLTGKSVHFWRKCVSVLCQLLHP